MSSDPWRYACPDCGSVSVEQRVQTKADGWRRAHRKQALHAEYERPSPWYCKACKARLDAVVDKKTGEAVTERQPTA